MGKAFVIPADVIAAAQASEHKWRVPASLSIAQWQLESANGKSMSGKNNPFGIKARAGQAGTVKPTKEEVNGRWVPAKAVFADYASLTDAFDAHGRLLGTVKCYAPAFSSAGLIGFVTAVAKHYATDSNYAPKVMKLIAAGNLSQYDAPGLFPMKGPQQGKG